LLGGAGFAATVLESLADTPILSLRDVTLSIVIVSALLAAVFMVVKALLVEIDRVRALESVKRAAV
jgi:hypothetical protein